MDRVFFFEDYVRCSQCGKDTLGVVWEKSGRIDCDQCGEAMLDATEMDGGTVIILELEDETFH